MCKATCDLSFYPFLFCLSRSNSRSFCIFMQQVDARHNKFSPFIYNGILLNAINLIKFLPQQLLARRMAPHSALCIHYVCFTFIMYCFLACVLPAGAVVGWMIMDTFLLHTLSFSHFHTVTYKIDASAYYILELLYCCVINVGRTFGCLQIFRVSQNPVIAAYMRT